MTPEEHAVKAYRELYPENKDELAALKVKDGWIIVQLVCGHVLRAQARLTSNYEEVPGNPIKTSEEASQVARYKTSKATLR
jgi:hypothetical protein